MTGNAPSVSVCMSVFPSVVCFSLIPLLDANHSLSVVCFVYHYVLRELIVPSFPYDVIERRK